MSCSVELIRDIYRAWPNFDPDVVAPLKDQAPDVGVLRMNFAVGSPPEPNEEMIGIAAPAFARLIKQSGICADGFNAFVFATDRVVQPDSRIVRYKRIWRSASQFHDLAGLTLGNELLIEELNGIRFAANAGISPSSFESAFRIASSTHYSSFILITTRRDLLSEDSVREMYELSFPEVRGRSERQNGFSIANVCLFSCLRGEAVVTCGFETDHSVWLVDVFANPQMLTRFERVKGVLDLNGKH